MEQTTQTNAPRVLLVACGGIAAYKAVEVLRGLQRADCDVRVMCTADALEFVGRATWEGLVHRKVAISLYDDPDSTIPHVQLAGWADVVAVVPATANVMAKMACGLADDLVSTTLLAVPAATPVVVAPAMNTHMWLADATQHNVDVLRARGVRMVRPVCGHLACDERGDGKLAPVDDIVEAVLDAGSSTPQSLAGRHVMITAGPTHEAIDPVRYIANASSGKMGYALAAEAARRGARVTLVSGPVSLQAPRGTDRVDVVSSQDMHDAAVEAFADADVAICAAAVADYTPAHPATHKLKKDHEHLDTIELVETADILARLCATKDQGGSHRVVVGFAAETNDLLAHAQRKLECKGCDLIVANDVSRQDSGFGSNTNRVTLVSAQGVTELPTLPKQEVAARVLDCVEVLLGQKEDKR
ncbi:MAG: bifunctional phosphopantothenoylcysteine decarboxylase/phosphopantothenate--cysteine ligase CoaBC [Coriobacteriales bacterium]|nr:bifunctional phosphopantothenoylcysteine decarboxylase/phosphopantothenate--cysteine ligase CoaBC [Coriobacteriales bacterium]